MIKYLYLGSCVCLFWSQLQNKKKDFCFRIFYSWNSNSMIKYISYLGCFFPPQEHARNTKNKAYDLKKQQAISFLQINKTKPCLFAETQWCFQNELPPVRPPAVMRWPLVAQRCRHASLQRLHIQAWRRRRPCFASSSSSAKGLCLGVNVPEELRLSLICIKSPYQLYLFELLMEMHWLARCRWRTRFRWVCLRRRVEMYEQW